MTDNQNAIEVKNVKKHFRIYLDRGGTLKEKLLFSKRRRYEDRWVLSGISFSVKKGEAVGLIGHNGCGKSTTLKLLTKIYYPDEGSVEMKGRVSSLIELGAGFHPDMSGRENIYTNASIFGLTYKEIEQRVNDIIAFSELEEFIDNPVRTYSSGMYMRLAFAVAINVDADVLLIDEILAVGDAAFQAKCFNKLREIKAKGTTIVIVSHSLGQIEQICDRSIWIDEGKIRMEGKPRDVHPYYMEYMSQKNHLDAPERHTQQAEAESKEKEKSVVPGDGSETEKSVPENSEVSKNTEVKKRWGNGDAEITDVRLIGANKAESSTFATNESISIEIEYRAKKVLEGAVVGIGIFTIDDINVYGTNTLIDHISDLTLDGTGKVICNIEKLNLVSGEYKLDIALHAADGLAYDYWKEKSRFRVTSSSQEIGVAHLEHNWKY